MTRSNGSWVVAVWLLLAAFVLGVAAPPVGEPGLYYDEAFLAQQARDFLDPDRLTQHPPGTSATYIAGRPFPLRNAAYLGSLKSQLLIPTLATFGADVATLRTATLATALLGLLFTLLWAHRVFGLGPALLAGALVAFDPSFVFFGACEWGPFTTLLLCRGFGLYALTHGWQTGRGWLVVLGAFAMGLGVYVRADFVLIGIAAAVGLVAAHGRTLASEVRERAWTATAALAAVVIGALPMLVSVSDLLTTQAGIASRGGFGYRAQVLWSTLDGSHFYRVIATGGLFEQLFEVDAPMSVFGIATMAALFSGVALWLRHREPSLIFLLATVASLTAMMCALAGAVRAHHMLNLLPFAHLLVAVVLVGIARGRGRATQVLAACVALILVASEARVGAQTRELISETGGRGRFSNSLDAFAAEIDRDPSAVAISLDWGFHEPLLFLTTKRGLVEPIWNIPRLLAHGRPWAHVGDENHVYLVHDAPYDLFGYGGKLLDLARTQSPELAQVRAHRDRQDAPAFYSVRFLAPHQLVYTGSFDVRFEGHPNGGTRR